MIKNVLVYKKSNCKIVVMVENLIVKYSDAKNAIVKNVTLKIENAVYS